MGVGGAGRRGRGEGHASKNNYEYKWKKESITGCQSSSPTLGMQTDIFQSQAIFC